VLQIPACTPRKLGYYDVAVSEQVDVKIDVVDRLNVLARTWGMQEIDAYVSRYIDLGDVPRQKVWDF